MKLAEREVTVPVGRRGRGQHEGITGAIPHQRVDLAEVVGHEVDGASGEVLASDGRQEVRHMAQVVTELAAQVGPIVQGVHLVDPHALELCGMGLEHVEHAHGLAVGQGDDEVGLVADVLEHRLDRHREQGREHGRTVATPAGRLLARGGHRLFALKDGRAPADG
jgi:hypothetical protein